MPFLTIQIWPSWPCHIYMHIADEIKVPSLWLFGTFVFLLYFQIGQRHYIETVYKLLYRELGTCNSITSEKYWRLIPQLSMSLHFNLSSQGGFMRAWKLIKCVANAVKIQQLDHLLRGTNIWITTKHKFRNVHATRLVTTSCPLKSR